MHFKAEVKYTVGSCDWDFAALSGRCRLMIEKSLTKLLVSVG